MYGLSASPGVQLLKDAGRMGLDRADGNEEFVGDFTGAESKGDELQDLQFPGGDARLPERSRVGNEGRK